MHVYVCIDIYIYIHLYIYLLIYLFIYHFFFKFAQVNTYIHTYIHTYIYIHAYVHTSEVEQQRLSRSPHRSGGAHPPGLPWKLDQLPCLEITWWLIPLSKWVTTLVINGISGVSPLISGVIIHLPSGMNHQVMLSNFYGDQHFTWRNNMEIKLEISHLLLPCLPFVTPVYTYIMLGFPARSL